MIAFSSSSSSSTTNKRCSSSSSSIHVVTSLLLTISLAQAFVLHHKNDHDLIFSIRIQQQNQLQHHALTTLAPRYYRINNSNHDIISTTNLFSFEHGLTTLLFKIKNERAKHLYNHQSSGSNKTSSSLSSSSSSSSRLPPSCWALVCLLQKQSKEDATPTTNGMLLKQVMIQALRFAGDVNDYRYIITLMDACVKYYQQQHQQPAAELLDTRLFGEAIRSLSKTTAGPSKLRHMWTKLRDSSHLLTHPPSSFEFNTMITALGQQGKLSAALELYRVTLQQQNNTQPDSYTYSAFFDLLSNSILLLQKLNNKNIANTFTTPITDTNNSRRFESLTSTPCWQWRTTLELLDSAVQQQQQYGSNTLPLLLNNFVYAAALKVNEKAAATYTYHNGAKGALDILFHMEEQRIPPDVVTCTAIMSALEKGKQWRNALALLDTMTKNSSFYPQPNAFTYTHAISACAQCGKVREVLALLDELRATATATAATTDNTTTSSSSVINTWVYNSALASYCNAAANNNYKRKSSLLNQISTIMSFLDRMESDAITFGYHCAPDTVTYNTALSCLSSCRVNSHHDDCKNDPYILTAVKELAQRMKTNNIVRDSITYKNAMHCFHSSISSSSYCEDYALRLFDEALLDLPPLMRNNTINKSNSNNNSQERIKIANAVLEVCANNNNSCSIGNMVRVMNKMVQHCIPFDSTSGLLFLRAIGKTKDYKIANQFIDALRGDETITNMFLTKFKDLSPNVIFQLRKQSILNEEHYAALLTSCIHQNDLPRCMKNLKKMKIDGIQPSVYTYETMAFALSKSAVLHSTTSIETKDDYLLVANKRMPLSDTATASSRAKAAKKVLGMIQTPSLNVLSTVCRACASSGLWIESIAVLKSIHNTFTLEETAHQQRQTQSSNNKNNKFNELAKLHRTLLSICARNGNVKAALIVVNTIQELEKNMTFSEYNNSNTYSKVDVDDGDFSSDNYGFMKDKLPVVLSSTNQTKGKQYLFVEDWKLVMIAASKAKKWQVCVTTLQTLRPSIESMRQQVLSTRDKESLDFALTSAVLCLEANNHYAWSIRVIHDWIKWSGTKPKKEALIAACRLIANSDKSRQVLDLLLRVRSLEEEEEDDEKNYFRDVYSQVIRAFHSNGDYESADELYCIAVDEGFLPWTVIERQEQNQHHKNITNSSTVPPLTLDLHGMTSAIAHSAVRVALQRELLYTSHRKRDIVIVTGMGKHSTDRFRPILRPQVQQMLTEEFYPPLSSSSLKGNMGALLIPAEDVNAWLTFHKQQHGARMLALADILRNMSSGDRLIKSLKALAGSNNTSGLSKISLLLSKTFEDENRL